ncbi:MAG: hypothetical protein BWY10_01632 [Chloroflexi bacterium ADurb.Bin180]|nr:MAG: hypothetical protein BWY10_01632 [Chloroflexi bacterium ADurb.Bin180]
MPDLGSLCFGIIVVVGLLILWKLFGGLFKPSEPPQGTYNDKRIQSGGSIGGQREHRAYDDKRINSGGSIGGQREHRAHDHPDIDSGGSIGGGPSVGSRPGPSRSSDDGWSTGRFDSGSSSPRQEDKGSSGRVDDPKIKSGGSFGG